MAEELTRSFTLTYLMGEHAEKVQGMGMVWMHLKKASICGFGLRQTAGSMVLQRDPDRLMEVGPV